MIEIRCLPHSDSELTYMPCLCPELAASKASSRLANACHLSAPAMVMARARAFSTSDRSKIRLKSGRNRLEDRWASNSHKPPSELQPRAHPFSVNNDDPSLFSKTLIRLQSPSWPLGSAGELLPPCTEQAKPSPD